ncbi:hypothetical protein J7L48_11765 [bacterium]|nr:hypothetical protein [bacterium]
MKNFKTKLKMIKNITEIVMGSLLTISFSLSCVNNNTMMMPTGLKERITQYYDHVVKKNWRGAYSYNTDDFKKKVTLDQYKKVMEKYTEDWNLSRIELSHITKKEGYYKIVGEWNGEYKGKDAKIYRQTAWEKEEGKWKVFDEGLRGYFVFPIIDERK